MCVQYVDREEKGREDGWMDENGLLFSPLLSRAPSVLLPGSSCNSRTRVKNGKSLHTDLCASNRTVSARVLTRRTTTLHRRLKREREEEGTQKKLDDDDDDDDDDENESNAITTRREERRNIRRCPVSLPRYQIVTRFYIYGLVAASSSE